MTNVKGLLDVIEQAARTFPEEVEWFANDADLDAFLRGDTSVHPVRAIYSSLRIPEALIEISSRHQLFEGCKRIAETHGCEFYPEGDDWIVKKPLAQ